MKTYTLKHQKGLSLTELLIGLLLSLIVVLGMVSIFTTLGRSTAEASFGGINDSSVITGFLTADRLLQGVGFGLDYPTSSYGTSVQIFAGGSTKNLGETGDSIVWKMTTSTCNALVGGNGLRYVENYNCNSGLALPSAAEVQAGVQLIATPSVTLPNSPNAGAVNITLSSSIDCLPYGVTGTPTGGQYVVTVTADVYAGSSSVTSNVLSSQTCLFNLR